MYCASNGQAAFHELAQLRRRSKQSRLTETALNPQVELIDANNIEFADYYDGALMRYCGPSYCATYMLRDVRYCCVVHGTITRTVSGTEKWRMMLPGPYQLLRGSGAS
eukprot:2509181-Rhodomonas_salina.1